MMEPIECAPTPHDIQPKKGNSDLAQNLLMQHTLMNEGLRVAQNYALVTRGHPCKPNEDGQQQMTIENGEASVVGDNQEEAAVSRAAESTITALLSLSSNKNQRQNNNINMWYKPGPIDDVTLT